MVQIIKFLFIHHYFENSITPKFDLERGIDVLNRIYRPKEYGLFCKMAKFLGVSKQAMAIRLKRLGLLKKDYLQNPYALADVEKEDDE